MKLSASTVMELLKVASSTIKYKDPSYNEFTELSDVELKAYNQRFETLNDEQRKDWNIKRIMWLGYSQGKSFKEIAEQLNVPETDVISGYKEGQLLSFIPKWAHGKSNTK